MTVYKLTDVNIHIDTDIAPIGNVELPKIEPIRTRLENVHVTPAGWTLMWKLWAEARPRIDR